MTACVQINHWLHEVVEGRVPFLDKEFMDVAIVCPFFNPANFTNSNTGTMLLVLEREK